MEGAIRDVPSCNHQRLYIRLRHASLTLEVRLHHRVDFMGNHSNFLLLPGTKTLSSVGVAVCWALVASQG